MIAALICGQADGKFFSGRNLFPLINRPMMVYPLLAASHARQIDRVFLSTDSVSMTRIAQHYAINTLERSADLSAGAVSVEDIVLDGYRQIVRTMGEELEMLVVLLCNAPTVTADMLDKAIEMVRSDLSTDASVSVSLHNEFSPNYALRIKEGNRLEPFIKQAPRDSQVFFVDSLLWVLRAQSYFDQPLKADGWLTNFAEKQVVPLVHEGYGDVDYPWQVPAIESWLRQRGFTEERTPYDKVKSLESTVVVSTQYRAPVNHVERRVLITTIPFGEPHRRSIDMLEAAGVEYTINPIGRRLKEPELVEMIRDFGVLIAGTEPITARVIEAAPHLRLISRVGIGLDNVDLRVARERNILVSYTPDAPSPAVAELTIGLMLDLLRYVSMSDRGMRNGVWRRSMGRRLDAQTIGILGVGRVGKRVIRHLRGGFPNAKILANDLNPDIDFGVEYRVDWVDKETLYRHADIVSLHVPLTPITRQIITMKEIEMMKPDCLLINTARGNMINERDLADALRSGRLSGAAVDVFSMEPYSGELATLDKCILTCHMGSMSEDCRTRMELEATEEALRFLNNEPLLRPVPEYEYALLGL